VKHDAYPLDTEATDPNLDALLDEALSPFDIPGGIPDALSERIAIATVGRLPSQSSRGVRGMGGVIGRIGLAMGAERWGGLGRVAAVLALVGSIVGALVVWFNMDDGVPQSNHLVITNQISDKSLDGVLDDVAASTPGMTVDQEVAPIDTALDQLEVDIELAVSSTTTSWEELADDLEAGLAMLDSDF